jgi:hypothetical protein
LGFLGAQIDRTQCFAIAFQPCHVDFQRIRGRHCRRLKGKLLKQITRRTFQLFHDPFGHLRHQSACRFGLPLSARTRLTRLTGRAFGVTLTLSGLTQSTLTLGQSIRGSGLARLSF